MTKMICNINALYSSRLYVLCKRTWSLNNFGVPEVFVLYKIVFKIIKHLLDILNVTICGN